MIDRFTTKITKGQKQKDPFCFLFCNCSASFEEEAKRAKMGKKDKKW
ncbi:MAG: hypothetical protein J2P31_13385 [Blastocatellia bacterium]|nr:hypothetical protein [Blastocatellia bacterium]